MKIYLIRHGATQGNREKRYVGTTDEGLSEEARQALSWAEGPKADRVYVSPMRRCRETAELLYPGCAQIVVEDLRECDFGEFEYCNYQELNGHPAYQKFLDTLGRSGFPGGEDRDTFQDRCVAAFSRIISELPKGQEHIAIVAHGGTIMAVLDRFAVPHRDYYEWQIPNGTGIAAELVSEGAGGTISLMEPEYFCLNQSCIDRR